MATGVEINAQVLAAIDVHHPFWDINRHSSQGIPDPGHRVQIHLDVAIDGHPQQSAHFLLGLGDAGLAVEGIGLDDAETPRGDVGVAGQLDDAGHSVLHPHAEHDIGVIAHLVRAQHQHLAPAHPEAIEKWLQQNGALAQAGRELGEGGRFGQSVPQGQAKQEGQPGQLAATGPATGHKGANRSQGFLVLPGSFQHR